MITKFKIFEDDEYETTYKEDDYVKLVELDPEDEDALGFIYPYAKIISTSYHEDDGEEYQIEYYNEENEICFTWIMGTFYIERKMTDKEIEFFESDEFIDKINLIKNAKKYNL